MSRLISAKSAVDTEFLHKAAEATPEDVLRLLDSAPTGLTDDQVEERVRRHGKNEVAREKPPKWYAQLLEGFSNPFSGILIVLGIVSYFTDVRLAPKADWTKVIMLAGMIVISGLTRFIQEYRSTRAAEQLKAMVRTTATVIRGPGGAAGANGAVGATGANERNRREVPIVDLVPGDLVALAAGDMIPADLRLISSKDLFVSQSALTGESLPVEKFHAPQAPAANAASEAAANGGGPAAVANGGGPLEARTLCFMGTNVVSGSAVGVVVSTGHRTYFGSMAGSILGHRAMTSFDVGINKMSWVLIRFITAMVPIVFFINWLTKGSWSEALLFALAVAVGVTPEMLPMVVSANLAKGSVRMSRQKVIVKRLNSIQNFGAMDILCTDKTGTLTQDRVVLERHLDVSGHTSPEVLRLAFLNSYHQTGLRNLLDRAVIDHVDMDEEEAILSQYPKIDEIPFDFMRRRMSVVVQNGGGRHLLICKGAVEEMLRISNRVEIDGQVKPLDEAIIEDVTSVTTAMNEDGLRVVAVAYRAFEDPATRKESYSVADEKDLILVGYIGFLDPAKDSAGEAVRALYQYGVDVKILTGDNDLVSRKICRDVGIEVKGVVLGDQIDELSDAELGDLAERTTIFAKLNPLHKSRVILVLRSKGHTVGYMGDGINDAAALRDADVGISVDTAADIAKESADIILLEKSLTVLREGIIQGRTVFGNIVKYIKMAASSNFGNMFSVLPASAFLPFLPMLPLQILTLNLIYDLSQLSLPWDRMDEEFLRRPRKWDASGLSRFMFYIGPCSSVYDLATYYLMWFVFRGGLQGAGGAYVNAGLFQAGWFVESMMSQTLIIHMIRTRKVPFLQSTASLPVIASTTLAIGAACVIPFTFIGARIGLRPLPVTYWPWLAGIVVLYMLQTQMVKVFFMRKFRGEWL
ncbi:MAG: magnesium-translocating P-type ATPase [Bacillota bacterium]